MKKNNILQVFSSSFWGGGELYVYDLSKRLIEDHHKVICISKKSRIITDKLESANIPYYNLPLCGVFDLFSALKISKIIREESIDIIHVHNFKTLFPIVYAKIISKKKPKIILSRHLIKMAKNNPLYNFLYSKIDKIIFVSNMAREEFFLSNPRIEKSKTLVIHNSIKPKEKHNYTFNIKEEYNINNDALLVTFTGRIVPDKGVDILIKAFSKLKSKNTYLIIAGSGEEEYLNELNKLVVDNNLTSRVIFLGFVGDIKSVINQSDIGVFPSVWREPFGLSIIEFMQEGKAVITTNNGAQKEYIINNETGILVEPGNVEQLSNSLETLINNKQLREEIGQKGKIYFEKELSYEQFYKKIISTYNI